MILTFGANNLTLGLYDLMFGPEAPVMTDELPRHIIAACVVGRMMGN